MKLETRLRLESGFNSNLEIKLHEINLISDPEKKKLKQQELIMYIRLQINTAYKLGILAGAQKND